jgi:hypothetical protein
MGRTSDWRRRKGDRHSGLDAQPVPFSVSEESHMTRVVRPTGKPPGIAVAEQYSVARSPADRWQMAHQYRWVVVTTLRPVTVTISIGMA